MALKRAEAVALGIVFIGYCALLFWTVTQYAPQEREKEAMAAGYWSTIAAEDSLLNKLDLATLESTVDYGDTAYAEIHKLTRHYRVLHAKDAVFLQVWRRP